MGRLQVAHCWLVTTLPVTEKQTGDIFSYKSNFSNYHDLKSLNVLRQGIKKKASLSKKKRLNILHQHDLNEHIFV